MPFKVNSDGTVNVWSEKRAGRSVTGSTSEVITFDEAREKPAGQLFSVRERRTNGYGRLSMGQSVDGSYAGAGYPQSAEGRRTVKKMPQSVLGRCDFGQSGYNLNVHGDDEND